MLREMIYWFGIVRSACCLVPLGAYAKRSVCGLLQSIV